MANTNASLMRAAGIPFTASAVAVATLLSSGWVTADSLVEWTRQEVPACLSYVPDTSNGKRANFLQCINENGVEQLPAGLAQTIEVLDPLVASRPIDAAEWSRRTAPACLPTIAVGPASFLSCVEENGYPESQVVKAAQQRQGVVLIEVASIASDAGFKVKSPSDSQAIDAVEWTQNALPACLGSLNSGIKDYLACVHNNGYAFAQVTDSQNSKVVETGPQMALNELYHDQEVEPIPQRTLKDIFNFAKNELFSLEKAKQFTATLKQRKLVDEPKLNFEPKEDNSLDVAVVGDKPRNLIEARGELVEDGDLGVQVSGRHYVDTPASGFMDYAISIADFDTIRSSYIGVPLKQGEQFETRAYLTHANQNFQRFNSMQSEAELRWIDWNSAYGSRPLNLAYGVNVQWREDQYSSANQSNDSFSAWARARPALSIASTPIATNLLASATRLSDGSASFGTLNTSAMGRSPILAEGAMDFGWRACAAGLVGDYDEIPDSYRLYLGGSDSVRGYQPRAIGSTVGTRSTLGADRSGYIQLDLLHTLSFNTKPLDVGVHYDVGAINIPGSDTDLYRSIGFTSLWNTSLPVRMSLSKALDEAGKPWRFGLGINQPF